jgi:hypothetical protein
MPLVYTKRDWVLGIIAITLLFAGAAALNAYMNRAGVVDSPWLRAIGLAALIVGLIVRIIRRNAQS